MSNYTSKNEFEYKESVVKNLVTGKEGQFDDRVSDCLLESVGRIHLGGRKSAF